MHKTDTTHNVKSGWWAKRDLIDRKNHFFRNRGLWRGARWWPITWCRPVFSVESWSELPPRYIIHDPIFSFWREEPTAPTCLPCIRIPFSWIDIALHRRWRWSKRSFCDTRWKNLLLTECELAFMFSEMSLCQEMSMSTTGELHSR